jgi:hypothetical protein
MVAPTRLIAERFLEVVRLGPPGSGFQLDPESLEAMILLARYERIGGWLWNQVLGTARAGRPAPGPAQDELKRLARIEAAMTLKLVATTSRVLGLLSGQGIQVIPLKGLAYSALSSQFPFFRFRSPGDLDLLVAPGTAERAWRILTEAGFARTSTPSVHPDHHHLPTLIGDFQVPVEIHSAASLFWSEQLSWERLGESSRLVVWQGCELHVPAPTELCWHALIHSLGDGAPGCRMRNFLTVAALLRDGDVDLGLLASRMKQERIREHDSRHPVPDKAAQRWLDIATWLAGTAPSTGRSSDHLPDLVRLLAFRLKRLSHWPAEPAAQDRALTWMGEATRVALGLGLRRLGHWQPQHRQPRRIIESFLYQSLYRISSSD